MIRLIVEIECKDEETAKLVYASLDVGLLPLNGCRVAGAMGYDEDDHPRLAVVGNEAWEKL